MAKKIEKITSDQEADMYAYRTEMFSIGRSTTPCDRETAEAVVTDFYKRIGKAAPVMWWCDSPWQMQMVIHMFKKHKTLPANLRDNLRANLGANLGANLRDNLWDNLWANLGDNLGDNLRANLGANLRDNLRANLRDNLRANLWANLGDNLGANLGANLRDNLWDNKIQMEDMHLWGNLDLYWIAYCSWPRRIGITYTKEQDELLNQWERLGRAAHFWMPYDGLCFFSERPTSLEVDENGRLHNDAGMSVRYGDGYGQYNIHGVTVPAWIIEQPATIDIPKIDAEKNAEIKRIMMERMGYDRYLIDSKAKLLATDLVEVVQGSGDYMPRNLWEDRDGRRFLEATDGSTKRAYFMQVDPKATTPGEGHASINGGLSDALCVLQS